MASKPVGVGAAAPDFALRGSSHQSLCLVAPRGRPAMIAEVQSVLACAPAASLRDRWMPIHTHVQGAE
jgi:hypothetical protein